MSGGGQRSYKTGTFHIFEFLYVEVICVCVCVSFFVFVSNQT